MGNGTREWASKTNNGLWTLEEMTNREKAREAYEAKSRMAKDLEVQCLKASKDDNNTF